MTRAYDNWERLVKATLDREELRYLARLPSTKTSFSSSSTSSISAVETDLFGHVIQLAYKVISVAEEATSFKQECLMLKSNAQKLAGLLTQPVALDGNNLYNRPTRHVINSMEQVLEKALALVLKCCRHRHGLLKSAFIIIPAARFRKTSSRLENSIGNVSWLLRILAPAGDDDQAYEYLGLPPIAADEPILCLVWEQIAILYNGSVDERADAAASLVILARDNDRYRKLIIEEGGVEPLVKLMKGGKSEEQKNAAMAIGLLGTDKESVEHIIRAGVCSVFAEILREGSMKVQAVVAWAVSELASHDPKCQDLFAQHNIVQLLVSLLAFKTVQDRSKATSTHAAVVLADNKAGANDSVMDGSYSDDEKSPSPSGVSNRAMEMEAAETKAYRKAMAARALGQLAKGNSPICQSIIELRALLCFAVLLEKGPAEVQLNSAMALMEITAVAEEDAQLRESALKPDSLGFKPVVDQLYRVVEKADSELLVPCIKAMGNLAGTFEATETTMISTLVRLLDEGDAKVSREACIALTKFARSDNHLHLEHSKAITDAGGATHLVQLVYFGDKIVQSCALILLCYIAMHVPESEELAEGEVIYVLQWSSKQVYLVRVKDVKKLLPQAIRNLELYQSRSSNGYY